MRDTPVFTSHRPVRRSLIIERTALIPFIGHSMLLRTHITLSLLLCSSHAFAPPARAVVTALQLSRRPLTRTYATESDEELALYGAGGVFASAVVLYSEFTLKTTGCGLPAGPFGAVGAIEGVSYLAVIGIAGASLATKAKTGSGLKAGPGGLLGLAEGLAFTAIIVGLVVLAFQFADYGYLPNAIPVEGGRCD